MEVEGKRGRNEAGTELDGDEGKHSVLIMRLTLATLKIFPRRPLSFLAARRPAEGEFSQPQARRAN